MPPFPNHLKTTLTGHTGPVHCVAFSSGAGQYILSGSTDRTIHLSNPANPPSTALIQTYAAHSHEVLDLALSPDNTRFASVGGDKAVFLWDVPTARTLRRWTGHFGRVNCVDFGGGEDGGAAAHHHHGLATPSVVVSGSFDATVRIWDVRSGSGKPVQVLEEAGDAVSAVVVQGAEIVAGGVDGRVRRYEVRMGCVTTDVVGPPVTSLAATRDGEAVLVSALDDTVRLMDRGNGQLLQSYRDGGEGKEGFYRNREYRIRSCLGMADSVVVAGSESGDIYAWDLLEGSVVQRIEGPHGGKVASAVAWNGSGGRKEWASAGQDGKVCVWGMPAS